MNLNLDLEEIQTIIEALLFSSSVDIIADWNEKDMIKMIDLAVKIKRKTSLSNDDYFTKENIKISKENNCDNLSKVKLIKTFFNILEF